MRRYAEASEAQRRAVRVAPRGTRYRYVRAHWHALFALFDLVGDASLALARAARRALGWLRGSATGRRPGHRPEHHPEHRQEHRPVHRVLLLQLDHLGDAVMTTPMLAPLRRRFPEAELHVLASGRSAPVFEACDEINAVHRFDGYRFDDPVPWRWIPRLVACAWRLRPWRFDVAIDVRGELPLALLLRLTGARRRVGWGSGGGACFLTDVAWHGPMNSEWDARRALLAMLGVYDCEPRFPTMANASDSAAMELALASIDAAEVAPIMVHVGAGTAAKRWPRESWQALVIELVRSTHATVVLVGGEADRDEAVAIAAAAEGRVANWVGRLGVGQLFALTSRAALFIGADSGPAHVAAAAGCPTLVLFSGTNRAKQWRPSGPVVRVLDQSVACAPCHRQACAWSDHPCMRQLDVERVARAALDLIENSPQQIHDSQPRLVLLREKGASA